MDELTNILKEMMVTNDKILEWWKKHENDPVFFTNEGKKLASHLSGIIKNHSLALFMMGIIELEEFLAKETTS